MAEYNTPGKWFGDSFTDRVNQRTPEESYDRLFGMLREWFPNTEEKVLKKAMKQGRLARR